MHKFKYKNILSYQALNSSTYVKCNKITLFLEEEMNASLQDFMKTKPIRRNESILQWKPGKSKQIIGGN